MSVSCGPMKFVIGTDLFWSVIVNALSAATSLHLAPNCHPHCLRANAFVPRGAAHSSAFRRSTAGFQFFGRRSATTVVSAGVQGRRFSRLGQRRRRRMPSDQATGLYAALSPLPPASGDHQLGRRAAATRRRIATRVGWGDGVEPSLDVAARWRRAPRQGRWSEWGSWTVRWRTLPPRRTRRGWRSPRRRLRAAPSARNKTTRRLRPWR